MAKRIVNPPTSSPGRMTPRAAFDEAPKGSDAKNQLDLYMAKRIPGSTHEEMRKLMRAALELAHKVTHSDNITKADAFGAAQAAVLVVRLLEEIEELELSKSQPGAESQ